jgi:hypothetical protein
MDVLQAMELDAADISPLVTGWNQNNSSVAQPGARRF